MDKLLFVLSNDTDINDYESIVCNRGHQSCPDAKRFDSYLCTNLNQAKDALVEHLESKEPVRILFVEVAGLNFDELTESIASIRELDPFLEVVFIFDETSARFDDLLSLLRGSDKYHFVKKPIDSVDLYLMSVNLAAKYNAERGREFYMRKLASDIGTSLTQISGYCHLLSEIGLEHEEANQYIHYLKENVLTVIDEWSSMLDYSGANMRLIKERTNLLDFISEVFTSFEVLFDDSESKTLNLEFYDIDDDVYFEIDRLKLKQSLYYLVSRASESMSQGEVTLGVGMENGYIRIFIQDPTTMVNTNEFQRSLFKLSKDSMSAELRQGERINLSLINNIIEAHGGRLEVAAGPGEGRTYIISL
jgi:signal transduction histidine kinase